MDDNELENGFNLAMDNATSLIAESELLIKNGFFSRGYTLAQLSIEETGKYMLLYNAILRYYSGDVVDRNFLEKKGFSKHVDKKKLSLKSEMIAVKMFEDSIGKKLT